MTDPERAGASDEVKKSALAPAQGDPALFAAAVTAGRRLATLLAGTGLAVAAAMLAAMGAVRQLTREPVQLASLVGCVVFCVWGARGVGARAMEMVFARGRNPYVTGIGVACAAVVCGLFGAALGFVPYALLTNAPALKGFAGALWLLPFVLVVGSPVIVPLGLYFGHRARLARDSARDAGLLPAAVKGAPGALI